MIDEKRINWIRDHHINSLKNSFFNLKNQS